MSKKETNPFELMEIKAEMLKDIYNELHSIANQQHVECENGNWTERPYTEEELEENNYLRNRIEVAKELMKALLKL